VRLRLLIEVNADGFYQGEVVRAIESHEPVRIETSGWGSPVNGVILDPLERETLMALAALHKEFGAHAQFTADAVALVAGKAVVAELGFLAQYGLAELLPDSEGLRGYRITGEGFDALPTSMERLALADHREEADQALREEQ
jgi:hypothetical protein